MQPLLGRVDANKTLPNVFSAPFESFLQIFAKRVYESNFATFLVISTLIFCSQSQCLQFFNILIFDLDFGFWICFFAFWIVKNLYLKNLFLKKPVLRCHSPFDCNTSTEKPVSEKSASE